MRNKSERAHKPTLRLLTMSDIMDSVEMNLQEYESIDEMFVVDYELGIPIWRVLIVMGDITAQDFRFEDVRGGYYE